ncbi:hypothetical protein BCR33DRAFT_766078 [Rhizoclosmatium globosum]|uniref:Uncharacterized protein n=1 Tax=Rhizoclosmatium globosum TaxID=329046 RepID=A0A1Y2CC23_9FUNG|nr:hypothetical protein BCR33DRAFT_766078 [Rhizoclosmatium globosum]|eukprot:ORY44476.1 hypothetical protein BCR33DRAFT_766078 [Rhizoclosmatium globosum]
MSKEQMVIKLERKVYDLGQRETRERQRADFEARQALQLARQYAECLGCKVANLYTRWQNSMLESEPPQTSSPNLNINPYTLTSSATSSIQSRGPAVAALQVDEPPRPPAPRSTTPVLPGTKPRLRRVHKETTPVQQGIVEAVPRSTTPILPRTPAPKSKQTAHPKKKIILALSSSSDLNPIRSPLLGKHEIGGLEQEQVADRDEQEDVTTEGDDDEEEDGTEDGKETKAQGDRRKSFVAERTRLQVQRKQMEVESDDGEEGWKVVLSKEEKELVRKLRGYRRYPHDTYKMLLTPSGQRVMLLRDVKVIMGIASNITLKGVLRVATDPTFRAAYEHYFGKGNLRSFDQAINITPQTVTSLESLVEVGNQTAVCMAFFRFLRHLKD